MPSLARGALRHRPAVPPRAHGSRAIAGSRRRLYDTRPDCRIAQEMLLGIGGVRALAGARPARSASTTSTKGTPCSRASRLIAGSHGRRAWSSRRPGGRRDASIVFTTHTPVPAGNEVHAIADLLRLGAGLRAGRPSSSRALGGDPFNMTVAGLRPRVSPTPCPRCTGETARGICGPTSTTRRRSSPITNGVHVGTWQDPRGSRPSLESDAACWRRAVR